MLDEAQTLVTTANALNEISALRGAFQMNTGKYEPVFTGSSRDRLERMFADSRAPLYKYGERMEFPKLGEEFIAHVVERARLASGLRLDRDEVSTVFKALGQRPGDMIGVVRVMMRNGMTDLAQGLAAKLHDDREQDFQIGKYRISDERLERYFRERRSADTLPAGQGI